MKKKLYVINNQKNRSLVKKYRATKKYRHTEFILMTMVMPIHAAIATTGLPRGNADRGVAVQNIITACTRNANVTIAPATITIYNTDLANYDAATTATRVNLWRIVKNNVENMMGLFQIAANANPANSIAIIESGGFKVKKVSNRQKYIDGVTNGVDSGVIDLTGVTVRGRCCHDWWYSYDGVLFTRMRPTLEATTQMKGLTPGRYAYFLHELITLKNPRGLGQIMKIMVK